MVSIDRRPEQSGLFKIVRIVIVVIAVIIILVVAYRLINGISCDDFKYTANKDIPAMCLDHFNGER